MYLHTPPLPGGVNISAYKRRTIYCRFSVQAGRILQVNQAFTSRILYECARGFFEAASVY